jgi:hypothetical protein
VTLSLVPRTNELQCRNDNTEIYLELTKKLSKWDAVFLADAQKRIQALIEGYEFTVRDAKDFVRVSIPHDPQLTTFRWRCALMR